MTFDIAPKEAAALEDYGEVANSAVVWRHNLAGQRGPFTETVAFGAKVSIGCRSP